MGKPLSAWEGWGTPGQARFATTHWSVVLAATAKDSPQAKEALAWLCEQYWYPLYAYVRRRGYDAEDAKDLTQSFFTRLLQKDFLGSYDRSRGKFRSFLLGAMNHFLADAWDRERREKRGGGQVLLSIDQAMAEGRYRLEPVTLLDPETIYERRWAFLLLERVLQQLETEFAKTGRADQFELFRRLMLKDEEKVPYAEAAARLGMTEGAVKVAVHRLRRRYAELLEAGIAATVNSAEDLEEEIHHLLSLLSG